MINFRTELEHLLAGVVDPSTELTAIGDLQASVREAIKVADDELTRLNAARIDTEREITAAEHALESATALPRRAEDEGVLALLETLQPEIVARWLCEEERLLTNGYSPEELLRGLEMFVALAQQLAGDPELLQALAALPLGDPAWRTELTATLPFENELRRRVLERGIIATRS